MRKKIDKKQVKDRDSALYIEELGFHHADGLNFEIKGYLEKLVVSAPHLSDAHVLLGACCSSEGQFELAEKHFNQAYQLDRRQDRTHVVRFSDSYFDTLEKISVDDMASELPSVYCEDNNFHKYKNLYDSLQGSLVFSIHH